MGLEFLCNRYVYVFLVYVWKVVVCVCECVYLECAISIWRIWHIYFSGTKGKKDEFDKNILLSVKLSNILQFYNSFSYYKRFICMWCCMYLCVIIEYMLWKKLVKKAFWLDSFCLDILWIVWVKKKEIDSVDKLFRESERKKRSKGLQTKSLFWNLELS